ncbi:fumarylacetoacetase, partial [Bosea sp. CER48]
MPFLDDTHDPKLRSFELTANGHSEFPIQNLPLGVFSPPDGGPRGGIAIGDMILDLKAAAETGLLADVRPFVDSLAIPNLNAFLALGREARLRLRRRVSALLAEGGADEGRVRSCLHPRAGCMMQVPAR